MRLLIFLFLILLVSCSLPVSQNDLKTLVEQRISSKGFPELKLNSLKSKGGNEYFSDAHSVLRAYYKMELTFGKDFSFAEADITLEHFLATLGATRTGVTGLKSEGNKAGDTILVYGAFDFEKKDNKWTALSRLASQESSELTHKKGTPDIDLTEKVEESNKPRYMQYLGILDQIFKSSGTINERDQHLIERELRGLVRLLKVRKARRENKLVISSGGEQGSYSWWGEQIADAAGKNVVSIESSGSLENVKLLARGEVSMAIVQSDVLFSAFMKKFPDIESVDHLRRIVPLFKESIQIIVAKESPIYSIKDLKGKRINVGEIGSGTRLNAFSLLKKADLQPSVFADIRGDDLQSTIAMFSKGEIDAFFVTAAYPMRVITELAQKKSIRILSLDPYLVKGLLERGSFFKVKVPANLYPGVEGFESVGLWALLVTTNEMNEKPFYKMFLGKKKIPVFLDDPDFPKNYPVPVHDLLNKINKER